MNPTTPPGGNQRTGPRIHEPLQDYPEYIPADHADAYQRIGFAVVKGVRETSVTTFLQAWWALCWLHPGLHPDDYEEWPHTSWREFAVEAFRRSEAGSLRDHELYPAEATRNRLWRAHLASDD